MDIGRQCLSYVYASMTDETDDRWNGDVVLFRVLSSLFRGMTPITVHLLSLKPCFVATVHASLPGVGVSSPDYTLHAGKTYSPDGDLALKSDRVTVD